MSEKSTDQYTEYVKQAARLAGVTIATEHLPSVVENWATLAAIATLVTEFELPETIEAASTFEPSFQ